MRRTRFFIIAPLAFLLLSLLLLTVAPGGTAYNLRPYQSRPSTVIFAVSNYDPSHKAMEPVVLLEDGRYKPPPEEGAGKFNETYYRKGQKHRLLFGGGEAGSVTVTAIEEGNCVPMVAGVQIQTRVKLGGEVQALATNSETLGRRQSSRRAPTAKERADLLRIARNEFSQRKLAAPLIKKMNTVNLTATDLDGDGSAEMIGSFEIIQGEGRMSLFLIAEAQKGVFQPAFVWYHSGTETSGFQLQKLVDQVDLDGDGKAEVIAQEYRYEEHDFSIYQKQGGKWQRIYQGGGGGC